MVQPMFIPEEAKLAAKRGLAWLEQAMPEAVSDVRWEAANGNLEMARGDLCVLGHACPSFCQVEYWLSDGVGRDEFRDWAVDHGFVTPHREWEMEETHGYLDLDAAWREALLSK